MTVQDPIAMNLCSAAWAVVAYTVADLEDMLPRNTTYSWSFFQSLELVVIHHHTLWYYILCSCTSKVLEFLVDPWKLFENKLIISSACSRIFFLYSLYSVLGVLHLCIYRLETIFYILFFIYMSLKYHEYVEDWDWNSFGDSLLSLCLLKFYFTVKFWLAVTECV